MMRARIVLTSLLISSQTVPSTVSMAYQTLTVMMQRKRPWGSTTRSSSLWNNTLLRQRPWPISTPQEWYSLKTWERLKWVKGDWDRWDAHGDEVFMGLTSSIAHPNTAGILDKIQSDAWKDLIRVSQGICELGLRLVPWKRGVEVSRVQVYKLPEYLLEVVWGLQARDQELDWWSDHFSDTRGEWAPPFLSGTWETPTWGE